MDIIAVKDYPKEAYRAYWEIQINNDTFAWSAKLYDRDNGAQLAASAGQAEDMAAARLASQTWVKGVMSAFGRPVPAVPA